MATTIVKTVSNIAIPPIRHLCIPSPGFPKNIGIVCTNSKHSI